MTIVAMATRNPSHVSISTTNCTELQMHKTQHPYFDAVKSKLIDFTEHKLVRCIDEAIDIQQQIELSLLLKNYKEGRAAVAWREGRPIFVTVTREK